ncbi:MAG: YvcK family protein [Atopobiaceae bacterium]|jgi:uncharacterized cofD-like protein|nr:YvcK family protein [Atopobiaceae bacterium]
MRAVSIGGGTGQPATLRALRMLGCDITAVVAMADDGGSTGRLRRESGTVPPGDIRNCLVALASPDRDLLCRAFQSRHSYANGHPLGNLLITALSEEAGSFPAAVAECERMLGCVGRVMPSTLDDVTLWGMTRDGRKLDGESMVGHGPCTMSHVWIEPPRAAAYQPAVDAILAADLVVIGPGSLFTSIIPNLLVPGICAAVRNTAATRVFVCPKADTQGETWGLAADEYVRALYDHGIAGCLDAVLVHRKRPTEGMTTRMFKALTSEQVSEDEARRELAASSARRYVARPARDIRAVGASRAVLSRLESMTGLVVARDFSRADGWPTSHDIAKLASALEGVAGCRSRRR